MSNEERIEQLADQIRYHKHLYYNEQPEITDAEYDTLEDELRALAPFHPILTEIGVDASSLFEKAEHVIPMMSQDKVTSPAEFCKWVMKRGIDKFIVQHKLDGISIEVQYEQGRFVRAVTRGNGLVGDDVSANVVKMSGFLPVLKSRFTGATRGEVVMFKDVFDRKYGNMQNCRNTAAGLVRRKDGAGSGDLNIIYYDAISTTTDVPFETEIDKLKWLKAEGFPVVKTKITTAVQEVIDTREKIQDALRGALQYDIDGLVIKSKVYDLEDMKRAKPMKQIAFKFVSEEKETTLRDVEWSPSGANYTPVAIVDTVELAGTNVSRASLANPNLIESLGIKVGSRVRVSKRGDIIPKIESVVSTPDGAKPIMLPSTCDACTTALVNEGTRLYCPNEECPKRYYHRLLKWLKTNGVKHFSEKLILQPLFAAGRIKTIADLFGLAGRDLETLDGVQATSARKALKNLHDASHVPLAKFVGSFEIENIGSRMVQKLVDAGFDTLDKLQGATTKEIASVEGFADITASTFVNGFAKLYPQMQDLLDTGKVTIERVSKKKTLGGLTFCFTGKLHTMSRKEAQALAESQGGGSRTSVSGKLSYLVTNETTPTAKYTKARELGVPVITEDTFLKMARGEIKANGGKHEKSASKQSTLIP